MTPFPLRTLIFSLVFTICFGLPARANPDTLSLPGAQEFVEQFVAAVKQGGENLRALYPGKAVGRMLFKEMFSPAKKLSARQEQEVLKVYEEMDRDIHRQVQKLMDSLAANTVNPPELVLFKSREKEIKRQPKFTVYAVSITLLQYKPKMPRETRKISLSLAMLYSNRRWYMLDILWRGIAPY